eukprot:3192653-Heterocapsa_arctica.AAC.1
MGGKLIPTVLPGTDQPAVLPVLDLPPADRLPAEPGAASFRANPAGCFPEMRAFPARASA